MPVGATLGAAAFSGTASLASGYLGYRAANRAADQQAAGQRAALETYRPFSDMGRGAMTTLSRLYGIGANGQPTGQPFNQGSIDAFHNAPGYQFAQREGEHSILDAASRFGVNNSNTMRSLSQFNVGNADSTFRQSYVQPLLSLAGIGGQAAGGAAGAMTGEANARASGTVGGFNALGQGLQGAGSAFTNYANTQSILGAINRGVYGNNQPNGGAWSPQQFDRQWQSTPQSFGGEGGIGRM